MTSSEHGSRVGTRILGPPPDGVLRFIPLGGIGEIGKNLALVEHGDDVLVIDAGLSFPPFDWPGVDIVLPDISFLRTRMDRVRAVLLTHGHEDHIGALPFFLHELSAPVYGTRMTLGLLRNKLDRRGYGGRADLREVQPGETVQAGKMTVEFLRMTHSVPGSCGLLISSKAGRVLHTGDFKLDQTPADGITPDLRRLAAAGSAGVDLLLSDSTNAQLSGVTPSELSVRPALARAMAESPGRVLVVTFASNMARVRQVLELAAESGRRCCVVGRSMLRNVATSRQLGYLEINDQLLVNPRELASIPDSRLCLIATGSQGEPLAALSRIAAGMHPFIELRPTDTVVLAANPVPGNEAVVGRVINQLVGQGVRVLAGSRDGVHASGHAGSEELRFLLRLVHPRGFIPVHGEPRHLEAHVRLAEESGLSDDQIRLIRNGEVVELSRGELSVAGSVSCGAIPIFADGEVAPASEAAAATYGGQGVVAVAVALDRHLRRPTAGPEVTAWGTADDHRPALELVRSEIARALEQRERPFADVVEAKSWFTQAATRALGGDASWRPGVVALVLLS